MNSILRAASVLALATAALAASAQTVAYSNLSATPPPYNGFSVDGVSSSLYARFTPTATGAFSAFSGAVNNTFSSAGTPVSYSLSLYADGGTTVGTLLASYSGASTGVYATGATALSTVTATNGPTLQAGTAYWIGIAPAASVQWNLNNTGQSGNISFNGNNSNSVLPAFSVQVAPANPTPEPSALAALGIGAVALVGKRRKG